MKVKIIVLSIFFAYICQIIKKEKIMHRLVLILMFFTMFSCQKEQVKTVIEKGEYHVNIPISTGLSSLVDSIQIHSLVYPILKEKEENVVLDWDFYLAKGRKSVYLKGLDFSIEDTELSDIESFSIGLINDAEGEDIIETVKIDGKKVLHFTGKRKLSEGKNTVRLHVTLKPNADIKNKLIVKPLSMMLNGQKYNFNVDSIERRYGVALRKHNQDNADTYRIPGVITTEKGTLIAVYDIRYNNSKDLQEDIDIGMSRSLDGGQTWEEMDVIMDMGEYGHKPNSLNGVGDPAILYDKNNHTIWVAALWTHGMSEKDMAWWASKEGMSPKKTGQVLLTKSTNDGKTWSNPINITNQIKNPKWQLLLQGPGSGITLEDGTLVFPAQFKEDLGEKAIDGGKYTCQSTIFYSKDSGKTWEIGTGAKTNTTEAQVIQLNDGRLMLNMRDDRNRKDKSDTNGRAVAVTSDMGKTWTLHSTSNSALPESNCQASFFKENFLINGKMQSLVLFSNPASKVARNNMTIKVSTDDAESWQKTNATLIDSGNGRGYSSLTKVDDEHVGIVYEGSGADLIFQILNINELVGK